MIITSCSLLSFTCHLGYITSDVTSKRHRQRLAATCLSVSQSDPNCTLPAAESHCTNEALQSMLPCLAKIFRLNKFYEIKTEKLLAFFYLEFLFFFNEKTYIADCLNCKRVVKILRECN